MAVTKASELAEALKLKQDLIIIEGELSGKVFRIIITGRLAWAVALSAITAAVILVIAFPPSAPVDAGLAAGAVLILGAPATIAAITIAVAAGGVGVLSTLRGYKIQSREGGRLVLERK